MRYSTKSEKSMIIAEFKFLIFLKSISIQLKFKNSLNPLKYMKRDWLREYFYSFYPKKVLQATQSMI